jgi:insulysin
MKQLSTAFSFFLLTMSPLAAEKSMEPFYEIVADEATLPLLNPALANRKVEKLILNNGLKVYLVSDPSAEQSAAGLAVNAGSWQDPKRYPGLAHFLEHMLFMGTAAYPKEGEYMQFITDHGGKVNAYTASDRTVYMLSINNDSYAQALDRFSHFFIDPLFQPNSIDRELHAVDQEHAKNIEHDGWRQWMILKETGNLNHPNSSFSTGNAQTLSGIPRDALKKWYHTHYSANQMHLVMISPLPIEEMRALAATDFSKIPSFTVPVRGIPQELTSAEQRGHMIFIKPIKDLKQLSLSWEVPAAFSSDIDRQAPRLVAYVLGQEGNNSLIGVLKKEKIAEGIHVGYDRLSSTSVLFSIDISLTDYGLSQLDTAITRTYQAIARLKKQGFPEPLFEELCTMAQTNYQYQSHDDAYDTVAALTDSLVYEDLASFPEKTQIPSVYDPEFIDAFVDSLRPDTCVYFVLANPSKTGVLPDTKEKWMNAEYAIKELNQARLIAWEEAKPTSKIQLPESNPYLPTELNLVASKKETGNAERPLLLFNDAGNQVYFAQDSRYQVPEVATLFTIKTPLIDTSPKSKVLMSLYIRALKEKLSSTLFFAQNAGLSAEFAAQDLAFRINVQGFSDKAPLLLTEIFSTLKEIAPTQEELEIYRASLAADYDNASKELPIRQASELLSSILFNNPTSSELLTAIKQISYEEFLTFAENLFATAYVEAMIYGNLTEVEADTMWNTLQTTLGSLAYPIEKQQRKQVLLLSEKYGPYMLIQNTDRQGNAVMLLIEEGDYSFEKRGVQQIVGAALHDAFFDTLRTKQQTAYLAKAWDTEEERQLLQYFAVQSSTHYPNELLARFELFLEDFGKNLKVIVPQERFDNIRNNIITLLQMPPENMPGMAAKLNKLAFEYEDFTWIEQRIQSMQELTYDRFCTIGSEFLSRDNLRRLAILVEGVLNPEKDFRYELITKEDVRNLGSFITVK